MCAIMWKYSPLNYVYIIESFISYDGKAYGIIIIGMVYWQLKIGGKKNENPRYL